MFSSWTNAVPIISNTIQFKLKPSLFRILQPRLSKRFKLEGALTVIILTAIVLAYLRLVFSEDRPLQTTINTITSMVPQGTINSRPNSITGSKFSEAGVIKSPIHVQRAGAPS